MLQPQNFFSTLSGFTRTFVHFNRTMIPSQHSSDSTVA